MLHTVRCANVCHSSFTSDTIESARALHVREHMARRLRDARRAAESAATWDALVARYSMPDGSINLITV